MEFSTDETSASSVSSALTSTTTSPSSSLSSTSYSSSSSHLLSWTSSSYSSLSQFSDFPSSNSSPENSLVKTFNSLLENISEITNSTISFDTSYTSITEASSNSSADITAMPGNIITSESPPLISFLSSLSPNSTINESGQSHLTENSTNYIINDYSNTSNNIDSTENFSALIESSSVSDLININDITDLFFNFAADNITSNNISNGTFHGNSTDDFGVTSGNVDRAAAKMVLISIVVSLLAVLTAGGNLLVIVAFKLDKQLQTVSNYFLLSLAVADLTIGIVSMPLYTVYLLMGYWPLKALMCDVWLSLDYTMSNASVANLIIISFDRYLSVTRPLTYRAKRTPKRAATLICCAWIVSSVLWTPWIFAWPYIEGKRTVPDQECYIQFLKTNQYITITTAMLAFYIPVIIMTVLYFRIYRETQKRQKDLPKLQGMHKSKKIKHRGGPPTSHPHHLPAAHLFSKKSIASSDEEYYSSASERQQNHIHPNGVEIAETVTLKMKLLACLRIDHDSDYMEESSTSDPPASPSASTPHSNNTLLAIGLSTDSTHNGNGLRMIPRQDSENSNTSLQVPTTTTMKSSSFRNVRMNFSSSLIPLLPVDTPSPTSPMAGGSSHDALGFPYTHNPSFRKQDSEESNTSSNMSFGARRNQLITTSFSQPSVDTITEDPQTESMQRFCHSPNESIAKDSGNDGDKEEEDEGEEEEDEDEDEDVAIYKGLIQLPRDDSTDSNPKPPLIRSMGVSEEDMDRFSEMNPSLVQKIESDTEDDDFNHAREIHDRSPVPPPVRPPSGTPALARRTHSNDSSKAAMHAKIAAKAATRVRKSRPPVPRPKPNSKRQERRQDQKAAKTLTAILLAFIITWTPYNLFTVIEVLCKGCVNETLYSIGKYILKSFKTLINTYTTT